MFIKLNNDSSTVYPYDLNMFRDEFSNVSLPQKYDDQVQALRDFGVYRVGIKPFTEDIPEGKKIELNDVPFQENGEWFVSHVLVDQTEEDLQLINLRHSITVRSQRNELLRMSDWTQIADAPVNQTAWATYRQALRDIPQQDGFPLSVIWPEEP